MKRLTRHLSLASVGATVSAFLLVVMLVLPLFALVLSTTPTELLDGAKNPMFVPALWLSVRTTVVSLALTILSGTPLAWWFTRNKTSLARAVEIAVDLPVVIPPAVLGVALLQTFGRRGLLGPALESMGLRIPFTESAVVMAQLVVSAPFYVQSAANAFRKLDPDLLIVARTLGASPTSAFFRIAVPVALPGLIAGASLAWARSLGEFGATLLFAGNMVGATQTMPLAIFSALESEVRIAVVFSLTLGAVGAVLLFILHAAPGIWERLLTRRNPSTKRELKGANR